MKKFIALVLVFSLCCGLGACGRRNKAPATTPTTMPATTVPMTTEPMIVTTAPMPDPTLDTNIPDPSVDTSIPDMTEEFTSESTTEETVTK